MYLNYVAGCTDSLGPLRFHFRDFLSESKSEFSFQMTWGLALVLFLLSWTATTKLESSPKGNAHQSFCFVLFSVTVALGSSLRQPIGVLLPIIKPIIVLGYHIIMGPEPASGFSRRQAQAKGFFLLCSHHLMLHTHSRKVVNTRAFYIVRVSSFTRQVEPDIRRLRNVRHAGRKDLFCIILFCWYQWLKP